MTGAMYAAIGGLKTHMANLNVIGNNIANVNTAGYKAQRMTFQESIYATSKSGSDGGVTTGGNNPSQIGYGSSIGSIDLNMTPGTYNPTGFGLDCMIDGEGFFMVGDKNLNINSAEDLSKPLLTRVGNFWKDPEGYIPAPAPGGGCPHRCERRQRWRYLQLDCGRPGLRDAQHGYRCK